MRKPALTAVACAIAALPLLAYAAEVVTVAQKGRAFAVRELAIARGGQVRFTNEDDYPHQLNVSGPGLAIDSGLQEPGEAIVVAFPAAGSFEVRCGVHPRMRLTVRTE